MLSKKASCYSEAFFILHSSIEFQIVSFKEKRSRAYKNVRRVAINKHSHLIIKPNNIFYRTIIKQFLKNGEF